MENMGIIWDVPTVSTGFSPLSFLRISRNLSRSLEKLDLVHPDPLFIDHWMLNLSVFDSRKVWNMYLNLMYFYIYIYCFLFHFFFQYRSRLGCTGGKSAAASDARQGPTSKFWHWMDWSWSLKNILQGTIYFSINSLGFGWVSFLIQFCENLEKCACILRWMFQRVDHVPFEFVALKNPKDEQIIIR